MSFIASFKASGFLYTDTSVHLSTYYRTNIPKNPHIYSIGIDGPKTSTNAKWLIKYDYLTYISNSIPEYKSSKSSWVALKQQPQHH